MHQAQKNEKSTMVISEQCGIPQVLQAEFIQTNLMLQLVITSQNFVTIPEQARTRVLSSL